MPPDKPSPPAMAEALKEGDPAVVRALLEAGGRVDYSYVHGYDALLHAVHGRDVLRDARLLELLELIVANGAPLSGISSYRESGLRVLSRIGRFDAVKLLLNAGADAGHLRWTPLMHAVATGSAAEIECLLRGDTALEETDWWSRTAWLIALQTGDLVKCKLLRDHGANIHARGNCRQPAPFYAIANHHVDVLRWLIEIGLDIEEVDDFGTTALIEAAQYGGLECVEVLLAAGANLNHICNGSAALGHASTVGIARRLLAAGADPKDLTHEIRRSLLGLPAEPDGNLLKVSEDDFRRGRTRRFGSTNPERMEEPFWKGMIQAGINAYQAAVSCGGESSCGLNSPVWCAQRFGQSITFLPDGRIVLIAGEHEDSYDPDFCIYNDVFVREADGTFTIFGYPESVFPPTDFHTATLAGDYIYIIGSPGYSGTRRFGETPVHRMDTRTFAIETLQVPGQAPGWIHGHRADLIDAREILVSGGKIATLVEGEETHSHNSQRFVLDIDRLVWRTLM